MNTRLEIGTFFWIFLVKFSLQNPVNHNAPSIVEHPKDTVIPKGEPVQLDCKASGNPTPQIVWYKDGEKLNTADGTSSHRVLLPSGSLFFLKVHPGKNPKSDSGIYWCVANNDYGSAKSSNATLKVATLSDSFKTKPKNVQAILGQQATLECGPPRGYPEPKITWKKDGEELRITEHDSRRTVHSGGDLIITDVQSADSGFYSCVATNTIGSRETEAARLTVYEKPRFEREPQDVKVEVGGDVDFQCTIAGDPPPVITWRKKDGRMPPVRVQVTGSDLHIDRVIPSDDGEYVCNGRNPAGSVEASARLIVHSPPSFIHKPQDETVEEGGQLILKCDALGNPAPVKFWSKEGIQDLMFPGHWSADGRIEVTVEGDLKISNVHTSDEGQYACSALNAAGSNSAKIYVKVSGGVSLDHPPPLITRGPANQTLPLNSLAILPCSASGRQIPTLIWLKNGSRLHQDSRFSVSNTGALHILKLKKEDSGSYTCRASNEDGEDEWNASLLVQDHTTPDVVFQRMPEPSTFPGPPGRPRAKNFTDSEIFLEWDVPQKVGDSQIFAYRLQYFSFSGNPSSDRFSNRWRVLVDQIRGTKYKVQNLRPSTAYVFVVRAENQHGLGEPSPASATVRTKNPTYSISDPNSDLNAIRRRFFNVSVVKLKDVKTLNSTAVRLTWKLLRDDIPVQGFQIRWQGPNAQNFLNITNKDQRSADISQLKPFTNYKFFVRPYYLNMEGLTSNILDSTTEESVPSVVPVDVQVRMMNLTTLRISWRPPPLDGMNGILRGYQVLVLGNDSRFHRNVTTTERAASVTMFHLISGMTYDVKLAVYNAAGLGRFYVAERVTMDDSTWKRHMNLERSDLNTTGAKFWEIIKSRWFFVALGSVIWFVVAVGLGCRYCYPFNRCRFGKSLKNGRNDLPFVKISDNSVASTGAGAREALWMDHQFYHQFQQQQMQAHVECQQNHSQLYGGSISGAVISCNPEQHCHNHTSHTDLISPVRTPCLQTSIQECDFYCTNRINGICSNCNQQQQQQQQQQNAAYYHSVGGSDYHQVSPPSPSPYATTTLVMDSHHRQQRLLNQHGHNVCHHHHHYHHQHAHHASNPSIHQHPPPPSTSQHSTYCSPSGVENFSGSLINQQQQHDHSQQTSYQHPPLCHVTSSTSNLCHYDQQCNHSNDKRSRQPVLLDFIPPPPAQPPPPVDPTHRDQQSSPRPSTSLDCHVSHQGVPAGSNSAAKNKMLARNGKESKTTFLSSSSSSSSSQNVQMKNVQTRPQGFKSERQGSVYGGIGACRTPVDDHYGCYGQKRPSVGYGKQNCNDSGGQHQRICDRSNETPYDSNGRRFNCTGTKLNAGVQAMCNDGLDIAMTSLDSQSRNFRPQNQQDFHSGLLSGECSRNGIKDERPSSGISGTCHRVMTTTDSRRSSVMASLATTSDHDDDDDDDLDSRLDDQNDVMTSVDVLNTNLNDDVKRRRPPAGRLTSGGGDESSRFGDRDDDEEDDEEGRNDDVLEHGRFFDDPRFNGDINGGRADNGDSSYSEYPSSPVSPGNDFTRALIAKAINNHHNHSYQDSNQQQQQPFRPPTNLPSMGVSGSSMLSSQYGFKCSSQNSTTTTTTSNGANRIGSLPKPVPQAKRRQQRHATSQLVQQHGRPSPMVNGPHDVV